MADRSVHVTVVVVITQWYTLLKVCEIAHITLVNFVYKLVFNKSDFKK
jgi:hypothetical protein